MTATLSAPDQASASAEVWNRPKRRGVLRWLAPMLPAVVLLILFFAGPVLWSVYTSFTNESLTGAGAGHTKYIGFKNFDRMWHDSAFHQSLLLTVLFVVGSAVIGQNTLGLILALLMRGKNRVVTSVISTVVVAAWVMPEIVAAFCWYAFMNQHGSLNSWFHGIGVNQDWLYTTPMLAVIIANTWRGTAFSMMVYSAAVSEIPPEITEAASIDGASGIRRLWYVTLPLIRRSIATNLMLITLQTLAVFTTIYVMTGGGPGTKSETAPLYMYEQAFKFYDLGYGTAMALMLLVVGALFSLVYIKVVGMEG
jgi:multiple sugar transport system permease protein